MAAENRGHGHHPPPVGRPFVKGQSGNPGGRPKFAELSKAARRLVMEKPGTAPKHDTKASSIAAKLIRHAMAGRLPAIRELWDRLEGKPRQEVTGAEGEDLFGGGDGRAIVASMFAKYVALKEAEKKK